MSAVTTTRLGREFDRFLYAAVGEDNNGMPLTVLSALARMDVDPWEEASKLTQLPQESAVTQLAGMLGSFRPACPASVDPARIAAPLIALLPRPRDRAPPMQLKTLAQAAPTKHPVAVSTLLSVWAYLIFMLLAHWLMGSVQAPGQIQPPPPSAPTIDSPSAPISSDGLQNLVK
jgi:hypothetical protein